MSENREISKDMKKSAADQDLAWEEVSVEHIVQDKWIDFRRAAYRFPDGTTFSSSTSCRTSGSTSEGLLTASLTALLSPPTTITAGGAMS